MINSIYQDLVEKIIMEESFVLKEKMAIITFSEAEKYFLERTLEPVNCKVAEDMMIVEELLKIGHSEDTIVKVFARNGDNFEFMCHNPQMTVEDYGRMIVEKVVNAH